MSNKNPTIRIIMWEWHDVGGAGGDTTFERAQSGSRICKGRVTAKRKSKRDGVMETPN